MDRYHVTFSVGAISDLEEIEQYLATRFSAQNAKRYIERIVADCKSLGLAPFRGTKRDEVRPGLRISGFERRVTILFEVQPNQIIIFGIYYGGRQP